jgi:hypothetical protein
MSACSNNSGIRLLLAGLWLMAPLAASAATYDDLVALFEGWRAFEQPPLLEGAPDYTAETTARRHGELRSFQDRLYAMDISEWPVEQQVDWHLVRAEMNGMDFNIRVLQPWARDPAFYQSIWLYQSDTPAHEGPTHHALVELWTYDFPLDEAAETKLAAELATIPPLLEQARANLTGNARELWLAGIKHIEDQVRDLENLAEKTSDAGEALQAAVAEATRATLSFLIWLREEGVGKSGQSGIGQENYTWYLQNVHLVPMTWEDEVRLLKRELDRAHASLKLEEHRNRNLPPLEPIASEEEYAQRAEGSVRRFADFLVEQEVLPPYDYIEPVLRQQMGEFVPAETRNFFYTVSHHEPLALWSHWYHWWDLARMERFPHPSPIRRGPLLYNIFDSRSEGNATGFEEMVMHAGLYDETPRSREIVWIMLAQRAARGLGSLYVHSNDFTMQQARDFHVAWTPRGWMREDLDLLGFEQLLYLRQPGYGTSYITGKYLMERLLAERSRQVEGEYKLRDFFGEVDEAGVIPVSLIRWQLTGKDDEIRAMTEPK